MVKKSGPSVPGSDSGGDNSSNKVKKTECLTYFYPMDGWKGEYGFDWFRLKSKPDPEEINESGDKAAYSFENIGKVVADRSDEIDYSVSVAKKDSILDTKDYTYAVDTDRRYSGSGVDVRTAARTTDQITGGDAKVYIDNRGSVDIHYGYEKYAKDLNEIFGWNEFATHYYSLNNSTVVQPVFQRDGTFHHNKYIPFRNKEKWVKFTFTHEKTGKKFHYTCSYDADGKCYTMSIYQEYEDGKDESVEFETKKAALTKKVKEKWKTTEDLINKLWANQGITSSNLQKDKRLSRVRVFSPTYTITGYRANGEWDMYYYEAAEIVSLVCKRKENSEWKEFRFIGTADKIEKDVKKAGLSINFDMLYDPTWLPSEMRNGDSSIIKTDCEMESASVVDYELEVEKEQDPVDFIDLSIDDVSQELLYKWKLTGFKAKDVPTWENGKFVKKDQEEKIEEQPDGEPIYLQPYWKDALDGHYHLFGYGDKVVFYPVPTLSLVDYAWRDKKRGLKNNKIELQVKTVGEFKKIYFEPDDDDIVDTAIGNGSTRKASDTVKLVAEGPSDKRHCILAKDKNGKLVGQLDVYVYKPIHLKICFVKVGFLEREVGESNSELQIKGLHPSPSGKSSGGKKWNFEDDKFIQIFGQAGIIFDDIAEDEITMEEVLVNNDNKIRTTFSKSELISVYGDEYQDKLSDDLEFFFNVENWNDELGENVFDYDQIIKYNEYFLEEKGIIPDSPAKYIDDKFMNFHPEYVDYIRVYVLDKYMVQHDEILDVTLQHLSYEGYDDMWNRGILIFRKSIELCDAKESNPLSNALLRYLGLTESFNEYRDFSYRYKTTSNVMDYSDYRYTLTVAQWDRMRLRAKQLLKFFEDKKNELKDKTNK